ncbi:TPA: thioester-forming surface-anchored protein, partial [Streptococcus equi subsp. zooepidemicus]|nr:thioester-forming surface-anchored protein [Streptococcus equi subsp. zooepidemicus]
MRKTMKKMLAASTVCIIMSGSFIGGSARILAEQYYGWNDGTRYASPLFLYVTPTNESQRKTENSNVVYCFNRDKEWPENWESVYPTPESIPYPYKLPLYNKLTGTTETFKQNASNPRQIGDIGKALVAVLANGYPNKQLSHDNTKSRILTQLAIWYFSDSFDKQYFKDNYHLTEEENKSLMNLIETGEKAAKGHEQPTYHLDIYVTTQQSYDRHKPFQNLLGSTLVPLPKPGPKPKPEPQPKPEPEPDPKPKPEPEPDPKPEPMPKPDPQPNPEPKPKPNPEPGPKPKPKPKPEPMPKPEPQPEPKPDPEPKPEPQPEPKP